MQGLQWRGRAEENKKTLAWVGGSSPGSRDQGKGGLWPGPASLTTHQSDSVARHLVALCILYLLCGSSCFPVSMPEPRSGIAQDHCSHSHKVQT